ncbi:MAG: phosphoglycerate mutase family protein [Planctomycetes bacterium]|nr:phosphoglycerate mutase family protein [Planctomycetota bacterium]
MQTIILVRHGYPLSWDQNLKARGTAPHLRLDPALAEIGRRQAALTAAHLAAAGGASVVLSSPFRRCLETADAIAAACQAAVKPDWRLGEVLLSQVLGSPFSPGSAMDPEWLERREGAGKPSHPESDRTIQERVGRLVVELKARAPFAQRVVLVSHEIILKELLKGMTGRMVTVDWHPAAVTTLVRAKPVDRQWRLVGELGAFKHLGGDDRCEPVEQIVHKYHPLDSRS